MLKHSPENFRVGSQEQTGFVCYVAFSDLILLGASSDPSFLAYVIAEAKNNPVLGVTLRLPI